MAKAKPSYLPRWTRRVAMDGSGRDPLGLSRASDAFTGFLLPSIITTTERARYFSFYPWAMRKAAILGDAEPFGEFHVRLDATFGLCSRIARRTQLKIDGIDRINRKWSEAADERDIDTGFLILKNPKGPFGQAYGACLQNLGAGKWSESDVWEVSLGRGSRLADAFERSIASCRLSSGGFFGSATIPNQVLKESAELFSLDGIREEGAADERAILTRIFFDLDQDKATNPRSHRQATLGLLLHVLAAYDEIGAPPERSDVDDSGLIWPHYYGRLYIEGEASKTYRCPPCFEETRDYWRQFSLHQFFLYAAEEFLQAMLDAMASEPDGLDKDGLLEALLSTDFVTDLERATGQLFPGPAELLLFYGSEGGPAYAQESFSCDHPLSEYWIFWQNNDEDEPPIPPSRIGRAFMLWTQLYAKWRESDDPALLDVAERASQEWWVGTVFEWGDEWRVEKPDWATTLRRLIETFASRHEQIRFHKGKLDAAWFEVLEGRYSRIQDLEPAFRASRHPQVTTVFQDLCLLEDGNLHDTLKPTEWGRQILDEVIRART